MTKCNSCNAPIIWIRMTSGKAVPCDARKYRYTEDPHGTLTLITEDGKTVRGILDGTSEQIGYQSHFATCPNASANRRRKK